MSIHVRYMDDWVGLYLNGKLLREGHSIQENDLIETLFRAGILDIEPETFWDEGEYDIARYPINEDDLEELKHE